MSVLTIPANFVPQRAVGNSQQLGCFYLVRICPLEGLEHSLAFEVLQSENRLRRCFGDQLALGFLLAKFAHKMRRVA